MTEKDRERDREKREQKGEWNMYRTWKTESDIYVHCTYGYVSRLMSGYATNPTLVFTSVNRVQCSIQIHIFNICFNHFYYVVFRITQQCANYSVCSCSCFIRPVSKDLLIFFFLCTLLWSDFLKNAPPDPYQIFTTNFPWSKIKNFSLSVWCFLREDFQILYRVSH